MSSNAENPHHLPTITTIAGTGKAGYDGDDKAATSARLYSPYGVAVDAYGNIYIADYGNNRLRKVDLNGNIDTIVDGNNAPTYIGYYVPSGVAVDSHGNIYFADPSNGCIYKKDSSSSIIYRIAGTEGKQGYTGDGGPADKATFLWPYGITLDADGNIYIADSGNHCIRKVDSEGKITTIAGTGEAGYAGDDGQAKEAKLNNPYGITADALGNIYIADSFNHCIRKVDSEGKITTIAGTGWKDDYDQGDYSGDGGPATEARLYFPYGVAVDYKGNIYIADSGNDRI